MNDETPSQKTWRERILHALSREPQDRQELTEILRDAEHRHLLDSEALKMIEGVLQVSEQQVRDIMIPRAQMIVVEHDTKPEDFLPTLIQSAHSRFPVVGENRDEVIGILLAKDLLRYTFNGHKNDFNMQTVLRPAVFIPESKRLDVLLKEFRQQRYHMAIVIDEYGGIAGLITIEDVLEQIVGEIEDEFDIPEAANIQKINNTEYNISALTAVEEFNEQFNTNYTDEEFDTIGGLVMHEFGHLPKRGETIQLGSFRFKILHADSRRVRLLRLHLPDNYEFSEK